MDLDVAILGGGIAGIAAAIRLQQMGGQPVVYERDLARVRHGHGFILLENGLQSLDRLGIGEAIRASGHRLERYELHRPDGALVFETAFQGSMGFRRGEFMDALESQLDAQHQPPVRMGMKLAEVGFEPVTRSLEWVRFENGSKVRADLFVVAEGRHSRIRNALFPVHELTDVLVKELVCQVHDPELATDLGERFMKFQAEQGGVALGLVPCGHGQVVWYVQFDARRHPFEGRTAAEKKAFVEGLVGDWADPVPRLISGTDFDLGYVWNTNDLDPLPALHGGNVALIGDAAHPFLPFTSQGVNAALQDVLVLTECLEPWLSSVSGPRRGIADALAAYSQRRLPEIHRIVASGRDLRERFLDPEKFLGELVVPVSK
jgi:2-polyprenyl-6-methoxyphenol hydroxylase-like FAD-dependent oxidoreductase